MCVWCVCVCAKEGSMKIQVHVQILCQFKSLCKTGPGK